MALRTHQLVAIPHRTDTQLDGHAATTVALQTAASRRSTFTLPQKARAISLATCSETVTKVLLSASSVENSLVADDSRGTTKNLVRHANNDAQTRNVVAEQLARWPNYWPY